MDLRCGDCSAPIAERDDQCAACGRTLGSAPARGKRPQLLVWAAVAAAAEVGLTLLIMRSCR